MASLAEKVAKLRAERGWTLKELSKRSGISISHLNAIEKGRRPHPSFQYIDQLSAAFGVSLCYFSDRSVDCRQHVRAEAESGTAPAGSHAAPVPDGTAPTGASVNPDWAELQRLYDSETFEFIASERSRPYVSFAKQLADQLPTEDPSSLLQLIAEFIREQREAYQSTAEDEA